MRLRIVLDIEAGATPAALAELRGYLAGMVKHQDLGTRLGVRDLERLGLAGVRLVAAELVAGDEPQP